MTKKMLALPVAAIVVLAAALGLLVGRGEGGGGGDAGPSAPSRLLPVDIPVTSGVVKRCLRQGGTTGLKVVNVGAGPYPGHMVLGFGPSGAPLGVALTKRPLVTRQVARGIATRYETHITADEKAIVVSDPRGSDEDLAVAESCLDPRAE